MILAILFGLTINQVAAGLGAVFVALLFLFLIGRQRRREQKFRMKEEEQKEIELKRIEMEEAKRLPELWHDQQIPVEIAGRMICLSELGHGQQIPVETDGAPCPGAELTGSNVSAELDGLGKMTDYELHGDDRVLGNQKSTSNRY